MVDIISSLLPAVSSYYQNQLAMSPMNLMGRSISQAQMPSMQSMGTGQAFGLSLLKALLGSGMQSYGMANNEAEKAATMAKLGALPTDEGAMLEAFKTDEDLSPFAANFNLYQTAKAQDRALAQQKLVDAYLGKAPQQFVSGDQTFYAKPNPLTGQLDRVAGLGGPRYKPTTNINVDAREPNPNAFGKGGFFGETGKKEIANNAQIYDELGVQSEKMANFASKDDSRISYQIEKNFPSTEAGMQQLGIANAIDLITRARTGAALNKNEQKFYNYVVTGGITVKPSEVAQAMRMMQNALARGIHSGMTTAEASLGGTQGMRERVPLMPDVKIPSTGALAMPVRDNFATPQGYLDALKAYNKINSK